MLSGCFVFGLYVAYSLLLRQLYRPKKRVPSRVRIALPKSEEVCESGWYTLRCGV